MEFCFFGQYFTISLQINLSSVHLLSLYQIHLTYEVSNELPEYGCPVNDIVAGQKRSKYPFGGMNSWLIGGSHKFWAFRVRWSRSGEFIMFDECYCHGLEFIVVLLWLVPSLTSSLLLLLCSWTAEITRFMRHVFVVCWIAAAIQMRIFINSWTAQFTKRRIRGEGRKGNNMLVNWHYFIAPRLIGKEVGMIIAEKYWNRSKGKKRRTNQSVSHHLMAIKFCILWWTCEACF